MAFWFIVWLVIAILVYRDADSRGMNGILWFLIVLIFGIIGIIIYLIVRKEKQQPPPPPPPS
ncbi:MAG: PLDc N-terminal domain-containing protein [Candidatus Bathyarchaeia archaeon]